MGKNQKIIFTVGTPGCGKSTWAKNYREQNPNFIILERDDIRFSLFGQTSLSDEDVVTDIINDSAFRALSAKKNIIFSNTNVNAQHLAKDIERYSTLADIEFKVFDVDFATCLLWNNKRSVEKIVPLDVMGRMRDKFENIKKNFDLSPIKKKDSFFKQVVLDASKKDAYIFDLDGTVAHTNGNRHIFDYSSVFKDTVDVSVGNVLIALKNMGFHIVFVSGRNNSSDCYSETVRWIKEHFGFQEVELIIKESNSFEKDVKFKSRVYKDILAPKYNILGVFEDRLRVVEMWRDLGVKCFNVEKTI